MYIPFNLVFRGVVFKINTIIGYKLPPNDHKYPIFDHFDQFRSVLDLDLDHFSHILCLSHAPTVHV